MDPALRKEKEAFKKRALAATEKSQEIRREKGKASSSNSSAQHKIKKVKKKRTRTFESSENLDRIKSAAQTAHRSNNPHRLLKSIIDIMKERYIQKNYEGMSLDSILAAIELTELKLDMRQQIRDDLIRNPKIHFSPEDECFLFKPSLGLDVRNKKQLLIKLSEYERNGLGGIPMSDIKEAVHHSERVLKSLIEDDLVICISRQDKEQIVFYNNPEFSLGEPPADFKAIWNRISVEGITEADVEKYLENVGLGAMQGEGRKRKPPGNLHKKTRKKHKPNKVMNTHLDNELLKDYSEDADKRTQ